MGFRFHKRIRIFKGLTLNLSKSGTSWTVGGPGASVNVRGDKVTGTVGAPGTGLSYRQTLVDGSQPGSSDSAGGEPYRGDVAVSGGVIETFDEVKNKGLDIAGKLGDPVLAAADGRVVYAGAGLRGYGNLIILKHNNTYLTAYAHNQSLLVREDQAVKQGQKIAEMGSSDADRVKLHFEVRRQGKPVDPLKHLPAR